jgi:hypothetical protein
LEGGKWEIWLITSWMALVACWGITCFGLQQFRMTERSSQKRGQEQWHGNSNGNVVVGQNLMN